MKTVANLALALSLSLAACGGGSKKEAVEPAPAPVTTAPAEPAPAAPAADVSCEQVADKVIELAMSSDEMKNAKPEEQQAAKDMMPQLRDQIIQECTSKPDEFTPEAKACVMNAATIKDIDACGK